MYTTEGVCDWCSKLSFLTKHEYIDGKCNHSCEECNELARFDVRLFNNAEMQFMSEKQLSSKQQSMR